MVKKKSSGADLFAGKFRMLQPKELAAATGFPVDYRFLGTKTDVVRQIGNAVVVEVSKALCLSLLNKKFNGVST